MIGLLIESRALEKRCICSHILRMTETTTKSGARRTSTPRKSVKTKAPAPLAPATYVSRYAVGDGISHPMFGNGTVTAIDENKLTIEFPESVTKQIIDGYVRHRQL